jgi:hypothetical protein
MYVQKKMMMLLFRENGYLLGDVLHPVARENSALSVEVQRKHAAKVNQ